MTRLKFPRTRDKGRASQENREKKGKRGTRSTRGGFTCVSAGMTRDPEATMGDVKTET